MRNRMNRILRRAVRPLAVAFFAFVIVRFYGLIAFNLSFLSPISEAIKSISLTDKYYQMMSERESRLIVIVDLSPLQSRRDIALALSEIVACRPAAIGVDCVFEGEKPDTAADNALRQIATDCPDIVFSYRLLDEKAGGQGYTRSIHSFFADEVDIREGVTNMQRDNLYSAIKRKQKLGWTVDGETKASFAGELVNLYEGKEFVKKDGSDVRINFSPTAFTVIAPDEILSSRDKIEGRIVLFGTMTDEVDMHYTPLGKMAGVNMLAYSVQTLIEGKQVKTLPLWLQGLFSLLLVMLTDVLLQAYSRVTSSSRSPFVRYVLGSGYVTGLVTFLWIAFLMWQAFLCFSLHNVSVEMAWAIAAMAFLRSSRNFCTACENYFLSKTNRIQK